MNIKMLKATLVGLVLSVSGFANAGLIAVTSPTSFSTGGADGTWGWEFTTSQDISVYSFGAFDNNSDGLLADIDVGLWDNSGTLLATSTISNGTSNTLLAGYRWNDLTSEVDLFAGSTYRIAAFLTLDDAIFIGSGHTFNPIISHTGNAVYNLGGTGLSYPSNTSSSNQVKYLNASFQFTTVQVPEPSTLAIFGLALMGLASRRFKKQS
jgi:hypothetical protein